jgi:hypothetical protein
MLSVKWKQQYAEFEGHVGMPERGSKYIVIGKIIS